MNGYRAKFRDALGVTNISFHAWDERPGLPDTIAVVVKWPDGTSHSMIAVFRDDWADKVIAALREWKSARD